MMPSTSATSSLRTWLVHQYDQLADADTILALESDFSSPTPYALYFWLRQRTTQRTGVVTIAPAEILRAFPPLDSDALQLRITHLCNPLPTGLLPLHRRPPHFGYWSFCLLRCAGHPR